MAAGDMFKCLLLLQSVMFIVFAIVYMQKTNIGHAPHRAERTENTKSGQCKCDQHTIRVISAMCNVSQASGQLALSRAPNASGQLVPSKAPHASGQLVPSKAPHASGQLVPNTALHASRQVVPNKVPHASSQLVPGKGRPASVVRGPITNCSLEDIGRRPGVVLLTTTNLAYLDVTLNMLLSIKQVGICVNTTIVAEEQTAYDQLSKRLKDDPTVRVVLTGSGVLDGVQHKHLGRMLMNRRQGYILGFLEKGYEVLFSDGDTFWFRDPFPFFQGEFDISLIDSKSPLGVRTPKSDFCAGFVYFKPTNASIQLVKSWRDIMESRAKRGSFPTDQGILNGLLKHDRPVYVKINHLDTNIFPYGPKFYSLRAKKAKYSTVVMHAASIRGHAAKVTKFKSSNMWLVNKTTEELVAEKL